MADLTREILTDRDKYPDDREIDFGDGVKVTVKQFRDGLIPKADMTRITEEHARERQSLREQYQGAQAQLADAIARAEAAGRIEPQPETRTQPGGYTREQLLEDPIVGPIYRENEALKGQLGQVTERLSMHERYVKTREYKGRLNLLGDRYNQRFGKGDDKKTWDEAGFLDYVQKNPLLRHDPTSGSQDVDLEAIYDRYTQADERALIEREAEQRGLERGKRLGVPPPTFGRRRTAIQKDKSLPESFDQVTTDQIANDPEIQEAMQQDQVA